MDDRCEWCSSPFDAEGGHVATADVVIACLMVRGLDDAVLAAKRSYENACKEWKLAVDDLDALVTARAQEEGPVEQKPRTIRTLMQRNPKATMGYCAVEGHPWMEDCDDFGCLRIEAEET